MLTETFYNFIHAQPVSELKRKLIAALRHAHNKYLPLIKGQDWRGQIPDMLLMYLCAPEIEARQFSKHLEDDFIKEAASCGAVGTLVERTSRLLILIRLPDFKSASAVNVMQAFTAILQSSAKQMRQSMTYDKGRGMAMHNETSRRTHSTVYFCDLHIPWQRGSNENINDPVRYYICPCTSISRSKAKLSSMRLSISSMVGLAKAWIYVCHPPSMASSSGTLKKLYFRKLRTKVLNFRF